MNHRAGSRKARLRPLSGSGHSTHPDRAEMQFSTASGTARSPGRRCAIMTVLAPAATRPVTRCHGSSVGGVQQARYDASRRF